MSVEHIEIDAFVKMLGDDTGGMSRPVQVIGSNGKQYILKNQNVFDPRSNSWVVWDSMFLQELLVHRIAKHLGANVPDCAIANVEDIFLAQAPSLRFNNRYAPGYHFSSNQIDGVENNMLSSFQALMQMGKPYIRRSWKAFFNGIDNPQDVPLIIALDLLTANFDRFGNTGNLIIASNANGERLLYCIDHGHCFGGAIWDVNKQQFMLSVNSDPDYVNNYARRLLMNNGGAAMSGLGEIFRSLDQYIDVSNCDHHSFSEVVPKIELINESLIDFWFSEMPDEWFVNKNMQIAYYKNYILSQKALIRVLLNIMAQNKAFDSYLGGILEWNVKLTGTP